MIISSKEHEDMIFSGGKVYVNRITGQTRSQKPGSPATNSLVQTKG